MSANKITWEDKVALNPRKERVNQWQDQDILELKTKFNANDDRIDALLSGYQGFLAIADTPTEDGYYYASENGTYTNAGGLVVSLDSKITIITVADSQTTFEKLEIPIDTFGYEVVRTIGEFDALVTAGTSGTWMILDDITLTANKTIPADVTLYFNGGSILSGGYDLQGNKTLIQANIEQIFDTSGSFSGTWGDMTFYPQWFGAVSDGVTDDTDALNTSIQISNNLYIPNGDYYTTDSIIIDKTIKIDCLGTITPDSTVLSAFVIGENVASGIPSRLIISGLKVERTYNGATENIGFHFLECNQSSFYDFESRYSKYNFVFETSLGGFAYNNIINPQAIGGFYNMWLKASATGFTNENKFLGGRCFATGDLDTHLLVEDYECNHNSFISMSMEGSGNQSVLCKGSSNVFQYIRTEGTWVNSGVVLSPVSEYNTVVSTRYDDLIDDQNFPNGRNQLRTYSVGLQHTTAINGVSTIKSTRLGASLDNPANSFNDLYSASGNSYIAEFRHGRDSSTSYVFKSIRDSDSLVRSSLTTNGEMFLARSLEVEQSGWNFEPLKLGVYTMWINSGKLYIKNGTPTSATDGTIVGTQS